MVSIPVSWGAVSESLWLGILTVGSQAVWFLGIILTIKSYKESYCSWKGAAGNEKEEARRVLSFCRKLALVSLAIYMVGVVIIVTSMAITGSW